MKKVFLDKLYARMHNLRNYLEDKQAINAFSNHADASAHSADIKRTKQDINDLDDIISCYIDEHSK